MGGDGEIERRQAKGTSPCDLPQQSLTTCLVLIASFSRSRHTGVLFPLTSEADVLLNVVCLQELHGMLYSIFCYPEDRT